MAETQPSDKRTAPEIIKGIQTQLQALNIQSATGILGDILIVDKLARFNGKPNGVLGYPVITQYFQAVGKEKVVATALSETANNPDKQRLTEIFEYKAPDIKDVDTLKHKLKKDRKITRKTALGILAAAGIVLFLGIAGRKALSFATTKNQETPPPPSPHPKAPETIAPPKEINPIAEIGKTLMEHAKPRRKIAEETDPEYSRRVDKELNQHCVNILVNGYGEEHDFKYQDYSGSISIFSLDIRTNQITSFSLSRDILTPELGQIVTPNPAEKKPPLELRRIFKIGMDQNGKGDKQAGFDLMRKVTESMTGLSIDYQFMMKDTVIRDLIKDLTGPLMVDVDKDHTTNSYKLDGVEHPKGFIKAGLQKMDDKKSMQYILAEDYQPNGKNDERSYRKNRLLRAAIESLRNKYEESLTGFGTQLGLFYSRQKLSQSIEDDSGYELIKPVIEILANIASQKISNPSGIKIEFPKNIVPEDRAFAVHDPSFGDGSVRRVHNISQESGNPSIPDNNKVIENSRKGFYPPWMLIPDGGDPYSDDLINNYWQPIRNLVRTKLEASQKAV